jgi:hypothetical protein
LRSTTATYAFALSLEIPFFLATAAAALSKLLYFFFPKRIGIPYFWLFFFLGFPVWLPIFVDEYSGAKLNLKLIHNPAAPKPFEFNN